MAIFKKVNGEWSAPPITAVDARFISNRNRELDTIMPKIYAQIRFAAETGENSVHYEINAAQFKKYDEIIDSLKSMGYTACASFTSCAGTPSTTYIKIQW